MTKRISILCVGFLLVLFSSCGSSGKSRYEAQFLTLFNTVTTIVGYAEDEETFTRCAQEIHDELKTYHELYDIYHSYEGINNLKTVNDQAGIAPVKVDQKIIDLLLFTKQMHQQTEGRMHAVFGSVLEIWHDYRTSGIDDPQSAELPPMSMLTKAAEHTDMNDLIIDQEESTVYLADPKMSLDVGSIGKGYAVEQVSRAMQQKGWDSLLISVGGNVRAIGGKGDEKEPWRVGIQNPAGTAASPPLHVVGMQNLSMVTSGSYQRYYTVAGKQYHHIIDPQTLMPSEWFTAVTILCEDSGKADALSTAVYNMPFEQGLALIERLPEAEAMWVFPDGSQHFSSGFTGYLLPTQS